MRKGEAKGYFRQIQGQRYPQIASLMTLSSNKRVGSSSVQGPMGWLKDETEGMRWEVCEE
jgi:hypothetical protein